MNADRWTLERESDGSIYVAAHEGGIFGVARLEFADGSYVEVDPQDPNKLLAIAARPGPTGEWLLRAFTDDTFMSLLVDGEIRMPCATTSPKPTAVSRALGRAAQMARLSEYDSPRRRGMWQIEILSVLAPVAAIGDWPLQDVPADLDVDDALAAVGLIAAKGENEAGVIDMLEAASHFGLVPDLAQGLSTAVVEYRAGRADVDTVARELLGGAGFDLDRAVDRTLSVEGSGADGLAFLGGMRNTEDLPASVASTLLLDRSWLPADLDLKLTAWVSVTRVGTECEIVIDGVVEPSDQRLFVRLFDPAPAGEESPMLRHIAPLTFDEAGQKYSAKFDVLPHGLDAGSGRLAVDVVDESGDGLDEAMRPVLGSWSYWVAAMRSDDAVLQLMFQEPEVFGSADRALRSDVIRDAARYGDLPADEVGVVIAAARNVSMFVTPTAIPSWQ